MAGFHKRVDKEAGKPHHEPCVHKRCGLGYALKARRAVSQLKAQHGVYIQQHNANYFPEAQRYYGKVVALEPERRYAYQHAEKPRHRRAYYYAQRECQLRGYARAGHKNCACICADCHESRMAQRKLTKVAR